MMQQDPVFMGIVVFARDVSLSFFQLKPSSLVNMLPAQSNFEGRDFAQKLLFILFIM